MPFRVRRRLFLAGSIKDDTTLLQLYECNVFAVAVCRKICL